MSLQSDHRPPLIAMKQCNLTLQSKLGEFILNIVAEVVPGNALRYAIHNLAWNEQSKNLQAYSLADSAFYQRVVNIPSVDLILSAAYLPKVLRSETKVINDLMLSNTNFGWVILGPSSEPNTIPIQVLVDPNEVCYLLIQDIDDRLHRLFNSEEQTAEPASAVQSKEHEEILKHFEETHERLATGKFMIRLPFKASRTELTNVQLQPSSSLLAAFRDLKFRAQNFNVQAVYEGISRS